MQALLGRAFRVHKRILFPLGFLILYSVSISFALPPATKYQPGGTLDPSCTPGSTNCSVQILPDQSSAAGSLLTTDGNTTSWTKTLTNLTLITPSIASITNGAATLSLPTTSDTLVGRTTTDTLTNKTITAGTNTITGLTNANLSGTAGITNANLANSTISGTALGGTLPTLTFGTDLSGTSYNGTAAITTNVTSTLATVTGRGNTTATGISLTENGNLAASYALYLKRNTDTSPLGYFLQAQNNAGTTNLFTVDTNGTLTLATPTTSAATYDILTRNTTTGTIEKIASTTFPSGSGTTNYVARFTGTNTVGTGTLYDNGTNVGIGTVAPGSLLSVNGATNINGAVMATAPSGQAAVAAILGINGKISLAPTSNLDWYSSAATSVVTARIQSTEAGGGSWNQGLTIYTNAAQGDPTLVARIQIPGGVAAPNSYNGVVIDLLNVTSIPAASSASVFLTQSGASGGQIQSRTAAQVLTDINAAPSSGGSGYIQNTTTQQASSNFNISGNGTIGGKATIQTLTVGLGGATSVATNTAFGYQALNSASLTGVNNVAIGYLAGTALTTGLSNSLLGLNAGKALTTGSGNVAIGTSALTVGSSASDNVFIGNSVAFNATTANQNVAIGEIAMQTLVGGAFNTAIGQEAMTAMAGGVTYNVALGYRAGRGAAGIANTALGTNALYTGGDGTGHNIAVGYQALYNTTSNYNLAIGDGAGSSLTTGSGNVILGSYSAASFPTVSNNIFLADGAGNLRVRVDGSGNVGIGTSSPTFTGSAISTPLGMELSTTAPEFRLTRTGTGARSYGLEVDSNGAFYINDDTSGSTSQRLTILTNGQVGIGTPTPTYTVDVQSPATTTIRAKSTATSGSTGSALLLLDRGIATAAYSSQLSFLSAGGSDWGMGTSQGTAGISDYSIYNYGIGANAFTILKSNNNVGVGTTVPVAKLEVAGNIALQDSGLLYTHDATGAGTWSIGEQSYDVWDGTQLGIGTYDTKPIQFAVNNTKAVTIANGGNVGINTMTPGAQLDISTTTNGNLLLRGGTNSYTQELYYATDTQPAGVNTPRKVMQLGAGGTGGYSYGQHWQFKLGKNGGAVGTGTDRYTNQLILSTQTEADAYAASSDILTLLGNGNVGIGTTSPLYPLDVTFAGGAAHFGSTSGNNNVYLNSSGGGLDLWTGGNVGIASSTALNFYTNMTLPLTSGVGASSPVVTMSGSNVGIGLTNPGNKLAISGSVAGPVSEFIDNTNTVGYAVIRINSGNADAAAGAALHSMGSTYGGVGAYTPSTAVLSGFDSGGISIDAENATGIIRFFTGASAAANERMRITSTGIVGIANTSPNTWGSSFHALQIGQTGNIHQSDTGYEMRLANNIYWNGTSWIYNVTSGADLINLGSTGNYDFYTAASGTAGTAAGIVSRMTILQGGNVGIGTTNPLTRLHVLGIESGFNSTTPGATAYGGLHLTYPTGTNDNAIGITFGAASTGTPTNGTQAGIWVQSSGSYGTRMYFGTTDSYATGSKTRMMIDALGNVGIGTISPSASFNVYGSNASYTFLVQSNISAGNIMLAVGGSGNINGVSAGQGNAAAAILRVARDTGTLRSINAEGSINASGADYAEYFSQEHPGDLHAGDTVCLAQSGKVQKCNPNDQIIGVVSTFAGFIGNDLYDVKNPDNTTLVALTGQVPIKVSVENGPIAVGDHLTKSPTPGVAMKATTASQSFGIALSGTTTDGTVSVFLKEDKYISDSQLKMIQDMGIKVQALPTLTDQTLYAKIAEFLKGIAERGEAIVDLVTTNKVQTRELCVGDTTDQVCVTKDQLRQLLTNQAMPSAAPAPTSTTTPTTATPTIATPTVTAPTPTPSSTTPTTSTPTTASPTV